MSYTFTRSDTFEEADFDAAYEGDKAAVEELLFEKIPEESVSIIGSAKSFFRQTFILNKENNNGFFVKITKTGEDGSQSLVGISVSYLDGDNNFCTPIGIATANSEFIAMDAQWYHSYIDFAKRQHPICKTFVFESHPTARFWKFLKRIGPDLNYPVTYLEEGDNATMTIDLR
jgi:hypothetical protein